MGRGSRIGTKHVVIIGANGQLGTELVRVLAPRATVRCLNHSELDITNAAEVRRQLSARPADVVINCAAYTRVDDAEDHRSEAFAINETGARNVAQVCRESGALCVYISTDYVFDGKQGSAYRETDATNPINAYGASKLAGESAVQTSATRWLIVRLASIYGKAGARGKGGNFVETVLGRARRNEPLRVVNDIHMSPVSASDAAIGIAALIDVNATGIVHLTNTGNCSWYEFASAALELAGLRSQITPVAAAEYPMKARRPKNSALATDRFIELVGHSPRPWREALRDYVTNG